MDRSKCDAMLDKLTVLATRLAGLQKERNELLKQMSGKVLDAARAHVYGLLCLVDGKDRLCAEDLAAARDVMRRFTELLPNARWYYETAAGGSDSRLVALDESVRATASDTDDPLLQSCRDEFRQDWPTSLLKLLRLYVHDQFKLLDGKEELAVEDFIKLYETAFALYFILGDESEYARSRAGQDDRRPQ